MDKKMKAAFVCNETPDHVDKHVIKKVFTDDQRKQIAELTDLYPEIISEENLAEHLENLRDLDVIFSTWGMPALSAEQIDLFPNLKAVFYAAGATRNFRGPFIKQY